VIVRNAEGLHARPADLLVRMANKFDATIQIGKNSEWVDCKSILSLLTLGAAQGTQLLVSAEGPDAATAIESISNLFEAGFDDPSEMRGVDAAVDS
jgi:phosphotransferase system HPr (HPr) family protein